MIRKPVRQMGKCGIIKMEFLCFFKFKKERANHVRLAVISDIHGNAVAFEAVLQDLHNQSPDAVVCLGDIVMRGPQPKECIELLHALNPLITVRGNHDHLFTRFPTREWIPQNDRDKMKLRTFMYDHDRLSNEHKIWLGGLPTEFCLTLEGLHIELYHASPRSLSEVNYPWASLDDLDQLHQYEKTKLVLFGHVHHAFVRQAKGRLVVNSGSIGTPFDSDNRASYAIVDIENENIAVQLRRVSYDIEAAIRIAQERDMPNLEAFEYGVRKARYPYNLDFLQKT